MNWDKVFAARTNTMKRSAVRELLKVTRQPGMISFAGGLPAAELFPVAELREATESVLRDHSSTALQYGESEGHPELRAWIGERYSTTASNVLIVSGAQQGLDLLGRVLLDSGDAVLVENPTYLALLSAWRPFGPKFIPAPREIHTAVHLRPKLIYVVPNYQNPQGTTLSLEPREELLAAVQSAGVALIEDDPYRELCFEGDPLPSLWELERRCGHGENVVYLSTFSKVLAPGLRIGWVIGPSAVIEKLAQARQAVDLQTATFTQHIVLELLRRGALDRQIPRLRVAYRERRDAMLSALQEFFPSEANWTRPAGGMFLMVRLPEQIDTTELLSQSLQQKVAFVPGEEFFVDGSGKNTLRLNFSNSSPSLIETGIRRLGEVIKAALSKAHALT
jgi:2-aminoadipate transaminase